MTEGETQVVINFPSGGSVTMPDDPFWPVRVPVARDGDPLPFKMLLLYHWQFSTPVKGGKIPA